MTRGTSPQRVGLTPEAFRRRSRWVAIVFGLTVVIAATVAAPAASKPLIGLGASTVSAAPAARSSASAFELTLEGKTTWEGFLPVSSQGTFRSRAPFCATGTFVDPFLDGKQRLTCDDGTGSLTVSIAQSRPSGPPWNPATWRIVDGSGSYAGLLGSGSLQGELLSDEGDDLSGSGYSLWRSTFEGAVDWDAVAPTIDIASAKATKLRRPAGAYSIKVALGLRDDVEGNPVSYAMRVTATGASRFGGGTELASTSGTAETEAVSLVLRVFPLSPKTKTIRLDLTASDPVGNEISMRRVVKLPR
jgi:hypothetical protein